MRWFIALLTLPVLVWAQGSEPNVQRNTERDRLVAERQVLVERDAAEERACRERFVVTACMDELRVRRRALLAPLRERELALDDAERRQRASDRAAARLARPQPHSAASAAAGKAPAEPEDERLRAAPAVSATLREPDALRAGGGSTSGALQAAERARAAVKRAAILDAMQAELARKNAERAASGKAVSALPVPPSAGAVASAASR